MQFFNCSILLNYRQRSRPVSCLAAHVSEILSAEVEKPGEVLFVVTPKGLPNKV